jgi:hypothetical protein
MSLWSNPTAWQMRWHTAAGTHTLSRLDGRLVVRSDHGSEQSLELTPGADVTVPLADLRNQFHRVSMLYPVIPADSARRVRFTYVLVPFFLLQELFFAVYKRLKGVHLWSLRWAAALAWIMGAVWLFGFHL